MRKRRNTIGQNVTYKWKRALTSWMWAQTKAYVRKNNFVNQSLTKPPNVNKRTPTITKKNQQPKHFSIRVTVPISSTIYKHKHTRTHAHTYTHLNEFCCLALVSLEQTEITTNNIFFIPKSIFVNFMILHFFSLHIALFTVVSTKSQWVFAALKYRFSSSIQIVLLYCVSTMIFWFFCLSNEDINR